MSEKSDKCPLKCSYAGHIIGLGFSCSLDIVVALSAKIELNIGIGVINMIKVIALMAGTALVG